MKQDETGTSEKQELPDEDADKEMIGGCCVCADDNGTSDNLLVYCDGVGCRVAVHEACYGIRNLPEGEWFCRSCEHRNRLAADSKLTPTDLSAAYLAIVRDLFFSPLTTVFKSVWFQVLSVLSAERGRVEDLRQRQVVPCSLCTLYSRGYVRLFAHNGANYNRKNHTRTIQQGIYDGLIIGIYSFIIEDCIHRNVRYVN